MAVRPTPGAHYFGLTAAGQYQASGNADVWIKLRVSRSGRRLAGATIQLDCGAYGSGDMKLSFRRKPGARIRRDGRFAVAGRTRMRRYRLSGRFVTAQYGRLRYSAQMRRPRRCQSVEDEYLIALYREGVPPFSGCRSQRAKTLARSATGRVFQQYKLRGGDLDGGWVPHAYACLFATPKRRLDLGQNYDDETVDLPRLTGNFLAYFKGETTIAGYFAELRVLDLRDPISVRIVDATPLTTTPEQQGPFLTEDLVLKANGSVAWTVYSSGASEPKQLWALDSAGQRLLDSGPGLELESLELSGSTLTWLHGGMPRSATLN